MFSDTVIVHWDNEAAPTTLGCIPSPRPSYPVEADLEVSDNGVSWTTATGNVINIQATFIFGATVLSNPTQSVRTLHSSAVLRKGLEAIQGNNAPENASFWLLHAVELSRGRKDKQPGIRQILLQSKNAGARQCVEAVIAAAGLGQLTRKILVLINPFGGTKKAKHIYEHVVQPMFQIAGLKIDLHETQAAEHATEVARTLPLDQYSAAITISGDGVFHELINGLLTRPDWEQARKLPVGIVGSGSANAMSKNLDAMFPELAALTVIKGRTRPMDVFSVTQNDTVIYSHLQLMWALLADVDFESESYRWMGGDRMTVAAIIRILRLRTYHGKLYLLPVDQADQHRKSPSYSMQPSASGPPRLYTSDPSQHEHWPQIISTTFTYFVATNLPWISSDFLAAPSSRLADGALEVIYSETMSPVQALQSVADPESGNYLQFPFIKTSRVRALVLEPHGWSWNKDGVTDRKEDKWLDVSGEKISASPVRVEVHPGVMNVLAPVWLNEDEWSRHAHKAK
ncbi:hypothetical protein SpCBS45565_g01358 [Spizellomyces sp. 'palustris']|nr:hypothetical protein SpCBS45565_g01358 [Spizellomyces sp. 'palustris']